MDAKTGALLLDIPEHIDTPRLILHATRCHHIDETYPVVQASLDALKRWMPWAQPGAKREEMAAYFARAHAQWFTRELLDFQWHHRESGELAGKGGFHSIVWDIPKFEIGYWLNSGYTGKGYATEAVNALVAFARDVLGARRLEIASDAANAKSRAVAERAGFTLEGILRQARRNVQGELADQCMYARVFD
jgi:RimJ/RimL family protein N-acetyltransferase